MHSRLLRTFLAVARSRNITRAAEDVHLAQSSVSDQIQSLEADLGTNLFTRARNGLELTPAGEMLQSYAREILDLGREARQAVQAAAGLVPQSLSIGALETIAAARLAPWLASFRNAQADIQVRLKIGGSGELMRALEDGEVEVVFCLDKGDADERFVTRSMSEEPMVLIAAPGRPPVGPDLAALASMDFVATELGCVYRRAFEDAFTKAGMDPPRPAAEAGSIGAITRLVAAGAGLALVPRLAVADALARGEILEMDWPAPAPTALLVMIWRRRRVQPPALQRLLAAASGSVAAVRPGDGPPRHAAPSLS